MTLSRAGTALRRRAAQVPALAALLGAALLGPASSGGPSPSDPSAATSRPDHPAAESCRSVMSRGASTERSDNAAAFQAALDAGGCVFVPAGEWRGVSNVLLRKEGTTVRCETRTTVLRPAGPTDAVLIARGGTGKWIEGCEFRSCREGVRQTAGALVVFDGTFNSGITGFTIRDAFRGLYDHANGSFHARDGMILQVSEYRIAIDGNTSDHYYDTIVGDNGGSGTNLDPDQAAAGVFVRSGGGVTLTNIDMIHSGVPLWVRPDEDGAVDWLFVSAFAADTSRSSCMLFEARTGGRIRAASLVNSWSSNCREDGVRVVEAGGSIDGIAFTSHRALADGGHAMHLVSGRNIEVSNAQFAQSGGALVLVESTMGSFSFNGGRIGAAYGLPASPTNIRIEPGRPGPFSIIGVDVTGAAGATISDASSTPNKVILGNVGSRLNIVAP